MQGSFSQNTSIPVARVLDKLDGLLAHKDFSSAERHLDYWLEDARTVGDRRAMLAILNEQIGLFRKCGNKDRALEASEAALRLSDEVCTDGSVTLGTTLINAATAYKAFGLAERALPLYERAKIIYESHLKSDDGRLGGLYNNMALALTDLRRFSEAEELFYMALEVIERLNGGEAEMAVTYCNLADLHAEALDADIRPFLRRAYELLNTEGLRHDAYYAFICEKCAPSFGCYGYAQYEKELSERARLIYEGT